jgi:acetylornithine deacetylase/succinyl-diaminopimelate desuccinylase-like protein
MPASYEQNPIGAHFELHIEQGPILESSGGKIGAVVGAQAYKWFWITIKGRDCHTGTTDFANRSDALLTASKMIVHSHNRASEMGCLASTGVLTLKPGSTNTVPGEVGFSLDIRSHWRLDSDTKATKFNENCIKCVEDSANAMFDTNKSGMVQKMTSGAGHDR